MDEEVIPVKRKRTLVIVLFIVAALAAPILFFLWWAYPPYHANKSFDEPKIVSAHLDEEPFARLVLQPGASYRPIEVMAKTDVPFFCGVVSVAPGSRFHLSAFGREYDTEDCVFNLAIPDAVGTFFDLHITYWDDPEQQEPTDSLTVPAVVVARNERVEFQALEDAAGKPLRGASVPGKVRVYARAITKLPSDGRDFAALFFTADPENGVPVLELMPVAEGDKPAPMVGQVLRYRSYGNDLAGYALWSPEPIRLGGRDGDRQITDVYVGIFGRDELDSILARTLKIDMTGPDTLTVTPLIANSAELATMTVNGKLLSEPLHLVRAQHDNSTVTMTTHPLPTLAQ